jgi:23S rRNA (uracil1939-C5)-methyltransferase
LVSDPVELRITSLAAGGDGLGRLEDGRVVFVAGGVPGDLVELADLTLGKRLAHASVGRVVEASPDRTTARCVHFGSCGGCAWQHIRYEAQLDAKCGIVRDALERIGGIRLESDIEILKSPDPYHYRARARLLESTTGIGYRKRGSRECIDVEECPILVDSAQNRLKEMITEKHAKPDVDAEPPTGARRRAAPEWEILAGSDGVAEAHRVGARAGPKSKKRIKIEVLGEKLEAGAGSFVQGNALLWDALAAEVRNQCLMPAEGVKPESGEDRNRLPRMVELFAGIGFLTLPLVRAGCRGVAFESGRSALRDLSRNLGCAGLGSDIEVVGGRVELRGDWVARFAAADLLLLDPPRTGLDSALREIVATAGPARIVYVSCDPATLARDLREFVGQGYELKTLKAIDLFPQTAHVEVVARLERSKSPAR